MKLPLTLLLAAVTPIYAAGAPSPPGSKWHGPARVIVQYGTASWYEVQKGPGLTASGEIFNARDLTAAHRSLPFGTRVRVTNLRNGRSVVVRINDRGPAIRSRLIDLSKAAARRLAFTGQGLARVKIAVVSLPALGPHNGGFREAVVGQ